MRKKKEQAADDSGVDDLTKDLVKHLNKDRTTAYTLDEGADPSEVKYWISTGSTLLDFIISNKRGGGIPFGRITEIHGLESSGKSLLAINIAANTQKMGGIVIYFDTEDRLLNKDFIVRMGLDPRRFVITNPGTIEGCFEQIESVIKRTREKFTAAEKPVTIIWDSLAATSPEAEIEGDYDPQSQVGIASKAMAKGLRKLTHVIGTECIALVLINQLKTNIKAMPFSDPYVTPYGKAVPFHASVRLRVSQGSKLKDEDGDVIGLVCQVKTLKNSLGPPLRNVEFPIVFGMGIDDQQSWYKYLHDKGVIKKSRGFSSITIAGQDHSFEHDKWKQFLQDPAIQSGVIDILEQLMVKDYDKIYNEGNLTVDANDRDSEV